MGTPGATPWSNTIGANVANGGMTPLAKDASGNSVALVDGGGNAFASIQEKRGGSMLRSGKPWLRQPTTTTGITHGGSATSVATTRNGRACIEITSPANANIQSMYFTIASGVVDAAQHVVFEVEDASEWNGGSWRLGFYTDNTFANGIRYTQTVGTANGWTGVHCIAPLATEWANVGSGSIASTMTQCIFQFQRKAAASVSTKLWVYEIAEAEKSSLPSIIIGADDGHLTWYTDGLPVLEKYGFSSYLAFIADDRGTATRMSAAQWNDAIVQRGHHAVVHGCKTGVSSLRDYFSNYTGYASPQAAMEADIAYNRDTMVGEGLDPSGVGRTVYALPQGYHQPSGGAGDNTILNALVNQGMTVGRRASVENAIIANGGWSGAARYLPIIGHSYAGGSEATNISAIVTQMQTEIAAGRSVILMFHEVRSSPSIAEQITPANLETLVAAAATLVRAGSARAGKLTDFAQELKTYTSPVHVGQ